MVLGKTRVVLTLAVLVAGIFVSAARAEEPKKVEGKDSAELKQIRPNPVNYESAATIDFGKELTLPFDSLANLGSRVEHTRKVADPVGLASAASELAVAEKVSGKKTRLTSDLLWKEAVELAKLRKQSSELKALRLMTNEEVTGKELEKLSEEAAKRETDEAKDFKSGVRTKGVGNVLRVQNGYDFGYDIYINGFYRGGVGPFSDQEFYIGHGPNTNTVIESRSPFQNWRYIVFDNFVNFNYRLDPNFKP